MKKIHLTSLLREIVIQRDSMESFGKSRGHIFVIYRFDFPFFHAPDSSLATIDRYSGHTIEQAVTATCTRVATEFFSYSFEFLEGVVIYEYPEYDTFAVRIGYGLPNDPTDKSKIVCDVIITRDFSNAYELYEEFFTRATGVSSGTRNFNALYNEFCEDVNRELLPNLDNVVPVGRFYSGKD